MSESHRGQCHRVVINSGLLGFVFSFQHRFPAHGRETDPSSVFRLSFHTRATFNDSFRAVHFTKFGLVRHCFGFKQFRLGFSVRLLKQRRIDIQDFNKARVITRRRFS